MLEIPGYRLHKRLGKGGMAEVYLATQLSLDREVAVKVLLRTEDAAFTERFIQEGHIVASLRHPAIITIHDIGQIADGRHDLAMEYLGGGDLAQHRGIVFSPSRALDIIRQLAGGLAVVHDGGLVHRDVKPANILFRDDGSVVLTDFGVAKAVELDNELTHFGIAVGSPAYSSPEQAQCQSLDARSDIYSLGVILAEMLTGTNPFRASSYPQTVLNHVQMPLPQLPPALAPYQPLLDRMLAKQPDQRFASCRELLAAIDTLTEPDMDQTRIAPAITLEAKPSRRRRRRGRGLGRWAAISAAVVATVAVLLCITVAMGWMTAPLLLALTFANGIGTAMRWPVFSALLPEMVSKAHLPSAMALNGVAMNASRIVGPLVAGAIIASLGSAWVFVLNAVLSILSGIVLVRWKRHQPENPLGRERLHSAMRVGLQFVKESPRMRAVIARTVAFFFMSTAIMALLPLTAQRFEGHFVGGAGTFTILLASMGAGAIISAMFLPRLRQALGEKLVIVGTCVMALATVGVALVPHLLLAIACMMVAGMALISTANSLGVKAQMALPNWVRARGMAAYQMSIMGGTAIGAALWGKVASLTSVPTSLMAAAVTGVLVMLLVQRLVTERQALEDLSPSKAWIPPTHDRPEGGRVVVQIEYRINPAKARRFRTLMQESRRSRLRQGAVGWSLLHSMEQPERYVEQIVDESWTEHLRRFERVTAADVALRERKLAFHVHDTPPTVRRYFETD